MVRQLDLPLMQAIPSNKMKQEQRHGLENFGEVYAPRRRKPSLDCFAESASNQIETTRHSEVVRLHAA